MTTNDTFRKEIRYDREIGDFRATLDGNYIGHFGSYHAAEVALDQVAYDLLMDGQCATAAELDGGASAEEIAAEALPAGWMRMPEGDILDADGMRVSLPTCPYCDNTGFIPNGSGTGDQSGGWADTCECQDGSDDDYGDALAEGAQGTYNGRTTIDPPTDDPSPMPPPWERRPAARPLSDAAELAVAISTVDGLPLDEARRVASAHLQRVTHGAGPVCTNCGGYGHMAIDCPCAPLPLPAPRPPRPRTPIVCGALLAEADRVMAEVSYAAERLLAA